MIGAVRDGLWLASRSLAAGWGRAAVLTGGLAVALLLPWFTWRAGEVAREELLGRAHDTPIVVGRKGERFDLVMSTLYFQGGVEAPIPFATVAELGGRDPGRLVPIHTDHTAQGWPIVGASPGYLDVRGLTVDRGRRAAVIGEAVAGAEVASTLGLAPGDHLRSDADNLYDLSGAYPLLLEVVGVLAPTGGPDDRALHVDLKTSWVIDGLFHGHEAVASGGSSADDVVEASPSLFLFTEITDETLASFHLHGSAEDWPISAVLAFPRDRRAHDQLLGDLAVHPTLQAVRPVAVVEAVLGIVLRLQAALGAWMGLVGVSTAAFVALVLSLSLRLRREELALMRAMGASRARVAWLVGVELAAIGTAAVGIALGAGELGVVWLRTWLG